MNGRVEVRAAVFGSRVAISRVEITLVCDTFEISFEFEWFGSRPVDACCVERVSQIDDASRRNRRRSLCHDGKRENCEHKYTQTLHAKLLNVDGVVQSVIRLTTKTTKLKEQRNANRNDWTRPHGRQHGATPPARRTPVRRLRSQCRGRRHTCG